MDAHGRGLAACLLVVLSFAATAASAWAERPSASVAIALLNAARRANRLPADLENVPQLSLGCRQWMNEYEPPAGQDIDEEELPGQPGYTELGALAARSSDFARGFFSHKLAVWGTEEYDNVWSAAPLHLARLFAPAARYAWYGQGEPTRTGEYPNRFCMGTGLGNPLSAGSETPEAVSGTTRLFSLPASGSRAIPVIEAAAELPVTPQILVHIPGGRPSGPDIILFATGQQPILVRAILSGPEGSVPLGVVTPSTRVPQAVGEASISNYTPDTWYVVPRRPLRGGAHYELRAYWSESAGEVKQTVSFSTRCLLNGLGFTGPVPRLPGCSHLFG